MRIACSEHQAQNESNMKLTDREIPSGTDASHELAKTDIKRVGSVPPKSNE